jgi:hypothetical protein
MLNTILLIVLIWGVYSHVQTQRRIEIHLEEIKYNLRERFRRE